jgi:PadR family transcriptional regulator, regulatory protein PadR
VADLVDDIHRSIFLAFVRVHVLHHGAEAPVYGLEMIDELRRHGYEIGPGTLYPIFHELEKAGFLRCSPETVNGKVRKYYVATDEGREGLRRLRDKIRELSHEVAPNVDSGQPEMEELGE